MQESAAAAARTVVFRTVIVALGALWRLSSERRSVFHQPGGLAAWVDSELRLDADVVAASPFQVSETREDITVEAAANWGNRWHL